MSGRQLTLIGLSVAAGLAALGLLLILSGPGDEATADAEVRPQGDALAVRVPGWPVRKEQQRDRIRVPGIVRAARRVTLTAEVDGRVTALGAREHDRVRAGQLIVQLDDTLRHAALQRAEAVLLRTQAMHRLAQIELDRQESLFRRGITSASELDRARSEDRATFGALSEARTLRAEAEELLERTTIAAPFDGVLVALLPEVGDRLQVGGPVGDIVDISSVKVEVGATDAQVVALQEGQAAEISVSVRPEQALVGTVERVGSAIDERSRKFPVEVTAENSDGLLLPGMVAEVTIEVGSARPVIRIPRQATIEEFNVAYVYVLEERESGLVANRRRVTVRPVAFRPTEFEVNDGLRDGELIAAANLRELQDGLGVVLEDAR